MDMLRLVTPETSVSMWASVLVVLVGVMVALQLGARDGRRASRLQEHPTTTHALDVPRYSRTVLTDDLWMHSVVWFNPFDWPTSTLFAFFFLGD